MYRFVLTLPLLALVAEAGVAQTPDPEFAVLPLPNHLRADAEVVTRMDDGTLQTLRTGTNGLFCIADRPGNERFSVECHHEAVRAYLERALAPYDPDHRAERDSSIAAALRAGLVQLPVGSVSYYVSGQINAETGVPDSVRVWSELAVPFADTASTGLGTADAGRLPWLMSPGRYSTHVMIGWRTVAWDEVGPPVPAAGRPAVRRP